MSQLMPVLQSGDKTPDAVLQSLSDFLALADIRVDGDRPWDIQLHDLTLPERVLVQGNLGLGESYMEGGWDVDCLDEFFYRLLRARLDRAAGRGRLLWRSLRARLLNLQTLSRAWQVGQQHYDIGNDFYEAMLDSRMSYSCGYWQEGAANLEEAQQAKLELVCQKLQLRPGMKVLDIGCGWGSFMGYAAEQHGVECVGVTISREQARWAAERYKHLPVTIRLQDYRDVSGAYDRVVSIGMFEHVGRKNHRSFMEVVRRSLEPDGLMLLHTIGKNRRANLPDPWLDKYIFPNGDLPSLGQIADAADGLLVTEDLHNFGADYDRTLMAWHDNFEAAWPQFSERMGEGFRRMWRYYLLSCAGAFRARGVQVWQWVFSPDGLAGGYKRPGGSA